MSMYREICRLRAEVCKWRTKAREEKLKRKALEERNKALDERNKELQEALKRAEASIAMRARARAWAAQIKAAEAEHRAGVGGAAQRLVQQKQAHNGGARGAPVRRSAAATDSGKLARSTMMRRRFKYLRQMQSIIKAAGPVHLPGKSCPDVKLDRAGHFDYKCRVLLACLDRPMKAGLLRGLDSRIERMIKYVRVYKKAIAHHQ